MKTKILSLKYRGLKLIRNRQIFISVITVLLIASAVVVRISMLNSLPVDQAYIDDQTVKLKPVRFDESAIEAMEKLQDSNVRVPDAQLPRNRTNPFSE